MRKAYKPLQPIPTYQRTVFDVESRKQEWDNRYGRCDLKEEQKVRLQESEYQNLIDQELNRLKNLGITKVKCLELACGSAPWTGYLISKGVQTKCSDYSEILVKRLRDEFGYTAIASDISDLSGFENDTFDIVIMAGGIYENPDPYFVSRVYPEVCRVLNKNGVFIQFCNRFLNFSNRFFTHKTNLICSFHPMWWSFIRRLLKKQPVKSTILYWLMPLDLPQN